MHWAFDKKIFYPDPNKKAEIRGKIKFITTGNFRNLDMVEPIIQALDILKKAGYSNAVSMAGGIRDWEAAGYDVEKGR